MSISASTYRKILSIKTWATNKLPTVSEEYTQAIESSAQTLTTNITNVNNELTKTKKSLETNISTVSGKIDTTMNNHKKNIKSTITGAMEIFLRRSNICQ